MNKFFVLLLSLTSLVSVQTTFAWTIENFDLKGEIQANGSVQIQEKISANFTNELHKHGIIRNIPYRYEDENGEYFKTPLSKISVTDENGTPRNFTKNKAGADLSLKIGSTDRTVQEFETYVITYTVTGVLNAFEEYDEFYWNVTGNEWDAPIKRASATITLPEQSPTLTLDCYTGIVDSAAEDCSTESFQNNQTAAFKTTQNLNFNEGLTVVLAWDKGLVKIPGRAYLIDWKLWLTRLQYLFLLMPVFGFYNQWYKRHKLKPQKAVIPLYNSPKGLSLGSIGALDHYQMKPQDLTAIIIQLCVAGFIKIEEIESSSPWGRAAYYFTALKPQDSTLNSEARYVYNHLCLKLNEPVLFDDIAKKSHSIFNFRSYTRLKSMITEQVQPLKTPEKIAHKHKVLKTLFILALLGSSGFITFFLLNPVAIVSTLSGLIALAVNAPFNAKGYNQIHKIKGYKLFLKTADHERLNWSEAQNIFEQNLPYAISLGLVHKWAALFKDKIQIPDWYKGGESIEKIVQINRQINQVTKKRVRQTSPSPSPKKTTTRSNHSSRRRSGSSRSGSRSGRSGGGFGGGGGSSW